MHAECWELALAAKDKPSALLLSRQNLPTLRTSAEVNESARRLCAQRGRRPPRTDGAGNRFGGAGGGGAFIGMNGFGASAPASDLYKHFGITSEAIIAKAMELIG